MKPNRRNHYRILHVQPEAPFEVIRASYRTLMGPLRMHPDMGGDHETAALINAAWAVLGDPTRRAAFDRTLRQADQRIRVGPASAKPPSAATPPQPEPAKPRPGGAPPPACPFCGATSGLKIGRDTRCPTCASPLGLPPQTDASGRESPGRRQSSRIGKDQPMTVYASCQGGPLPARLLDLSIAGASLLVASGVSEGQVIRLLSRDFEALARVVAVRRKGVMWVAGTQLLSVLFERQKGVVFSARA